MSTATGVSSDKQAAVLQYLKDHRINEELNVVVNQLCQRVNETDPFAFIVSSNIYIYTHIHTCICTRDRWIICTKECREYQSMLRGITSHSLTSFLSVSVYVAICLFYVVS
jgi:hypothetical protein